MSRLEYILKEVKDLALGQRIKTMTLNEYERRIEKAFSTARISAHRVQID